MCKKLITCLLSLVLLAGCQYNAAFDPKVALEPDKSLFGTWKWVPPEQEKEEDEVLVLIHEGGEKEYAVTYASDNKALLFRAYTVDVEGVKIVNLQWLNKAPRDKEFAFYVYALRDGLLEIKHINQDILKKDIAAAQELTDSVRQNVANPDLFIEPARFKKVN